MLVADDSLWMVYCLSMEDQVPAVVEWLELELLEILEEEELLEVEVQMVNERYWWVLALVTVEVLES